jgi:hypothetical protein
VKLEKVKDWNDLYGIIDRTVVMMFSCIWGILACRSSVSQKNIVLDLSCIMNMLICVHCRNRLLLYSLELMFLMSPNTKKMGSKSLVVSITEGRR